MTETAKKAPEDSGLIQIDLDRPLRPITLIALLTGLVLICFAAAGHLWLHNDASFNNIIFATGIAAILVAFNGQAVVRGQGAVFAGIVAVTIGVLGALFQMQAAEHTRNMEALKQSGAAHLRVTVDGLPENAYGVEIGLRLPVNTRRIPGAKQIDFIARGDELKDSASASVRVVEKTSGETGQEFSLGVPRDCLYGNLGRGSPLLWEFRLVDGRAFLVEQDTGRTIAATFPQRNEPPSGVEPCTGSKRFPVISSQNASPSYTWFISPAFAGDSEAITREEIDRAIEGIQSPDNEVSRSARNILSRAAPTDVEYILQRVREKVQRGDAVYRTKLRVSLALTEMLRRDKSLRDQITLQNEDINMLLDFAGSEDRTLRIYAGEFLYDLEQPAVTALALPRALNSPHNDALFNWVLVSQGGWLRMPKEEKTTFTGTLDQLRTKTSQPGYEDTAKLLAKFD